MCKWTDVLRTQNGSSSDRRLRKLWHTDKPSIQGPWTPFAHRHSELNLVIFPNEDLSKALDIQKTATEKLIELFEKQKLDKLRAE